MKVTAVYEPRNILEVSYECHCSRATNIYLRFSIHASYTCIICTVLFSVRLEQLPGESKPKFTQLTGGQEKRRTGVIKLWGKTCNTLCTHHKLNHKKDTIRNAPGPKTTPTEQYTRRQ